MHVGSCCECEVSQLSSFHHLYYIFTFPASYLSSPPFSVLFFEEIKTLQTSRHEYLKVSEIP
jgi:hypothetical protein